MNLESGAALLENDLTEDEGQYLTFLLSGELFAIHILSIQDLILLLATHVILRRYLSPVFR